MDELPFIATIAVGLTIVWALGLLTRRMGLSPNARYLSAGKLIDPRTPGLGGDLHLFHPPGIARGLAAIRPVR